MWIGVSKQSCVSDARMRSYYIARRLTALGQNGNVFGAVPINRSSGPFRSTVHRRYVRAQRKTTNLYRGDLTPAATTIGCFFGWTGFPPVSSLLPGVPKIIHLLTLVTRPRGRCKRETRRFYLYLRVWANVGRYLWLVYADGYETISRIIRSVRWTANYNYLAADLAGQLKSAPAGRSDRRNKIFLFFFSRFHRSFALVIELREFCLTAE